MSFLQSELGEEEKEDRRGVEKGEGGRRERGVVEGEG